MSGTIRPRRWASVQSGAMYVQPARLRSETTAVYRTAFPSLPQGRIKYRVSRARAGGANPLRTLIEDAQMGGGVALLDRSLALLEAYRDRMAGEAAVCYASAMDAEAAADAAEDSVQVRAMRDPAARPLHLERLIEQRAATDRLIRATMAVLHGRGR